jgi:hypothetical protein
MVVAVDVGGFEVGSDFSVNVQPQVAWKLSERSSFMVGNKLFCVQYDDGECGERSLLDGHHPWPHAGLRISVLNPPIDKGVTS